MIKKNDKFIDNWTEIYLDTLETLYGPIDLHPPKTMEETNLEWLEVFMPLDESKQNLPMEECTEYHINIYAILYNLDLIILHVPMDVEEMNERWIEIFLEETPIMNNIHHAA